MHILLFPVGFILWYLAYKAKPIINDEVTLNWEEKNINNKEGFMNFSFDHETFSEDNKSSLNLDEYVAVSYTHLTLPTSPKV